MNRICLQFALLVTSAVGYAEAATESVIPSQFILQQDWFARTKTFEMKSEQGKLGTVHRTFSDLLPSYVLYGPQGEIRAKATMRYCSWGPIFDLTDGADLPLGRIDNCIAGSQFELVRPNGQIVAVAGLNLWETKYTIRASHDQHTIALLSREFFRSIEEWKIQIKDLAALSYEEIHPDVFTLMVAIQSDLDSWKSKQALSFEKQRKMCGGVFKDAKRNINETWQAFQANGLTKNDFEQAIKRLDREISTLNIGDDLEEQKKAVKEILEQTKKDPVLTPQQKEAMQIAIKNRLKVLRAQIDKLNNVLGGNKRD